MLVMHHIASDGWSMGILYRELGQCYDAYAQGREPALPDLEIAVVHRSDGSGTTYIFVDYLAKVSPEWKEKVGVGTSVNWPTGVGQKGNEGVAGQVKRSQGSIGYIELIYALQNKLPFGLVQNREGSFVKADMASVTAAADGVPQTLVDQLAEGGLMVVPVGAERGDQVLLRLTKSPEGLRQEILADVRFVPLVGGALPEDETRPPRTAQNGRG